MLTENEIINATIRFLRAESKEKDEAYAFCALSGKECNGYDDCKFALPAPCLLFRDTYKKMADWIEEARRKENENNGFKEVNGRNE